jgi:F0F1-type ATP synthase membrane subunit b/b'
VRDQLDRLAGQLRGLQQQVDDFVAHRSDIVAEQAGQRVAAIVQAAERSEAEIAAQAHKESAELRERLRAEAQAEADRIRVEAQAGAAKIRTDAHADAARLREETLDGLRRDVDHICAQLAEDLHSSARKVIDAVAGGPAAPAPAELAPEPEVPQAESGQRHPDADVEEAVDELQSATAVLEQSLRHLHEIGEELSDAQ